MPTGHTGIRTRALALFAIHGRMTKPELAMKLPKREWSQISSCITLLKNQGHLVEQADGALELGVLARARGITSGAVQP